MACVLATWLAGGAGCAAEPPARAPVGHRVPRCGDGPLPPTCTIATGRFPRYAARPAATAPRDTSRNGKGDVLAPPSARAAAATRLFHGQRWPEAIAALDGVARGDGDDDRGNREIAEYQLAIGLYNLRELMPAEDLFVAITGDTAHARHVEGVRWTARMLVACPSARTADAILDAPHESIVQFESPQLLEYARRIDLLLARRLLERGDRARSRAILDTLRDTSFAGEAERCFAAGDAR